MSWISCHPSDCIDNDFRLYYRVDSNSFATKEDQQITWFLEIGGDKPSRWVWEQGLHIHWWGWMQPVPEDCAVSCPLSFVMTMGIDFYETVK